MGIGRASFEGANRATYADFFSDNPSAGFATLLMFSGISGTMSYFIFPSIPVHGKSPKEANPLCLFNTTDATTGEFKSKEVIEYNGVAIGAIVFFSAICAILTYLIALVHAYKCNKLKRQSTDVR